MNRYLVSAMSLVLSISSLRADEVQKVSTVDPGAELRAIMAEFSAAQRDSAKALSAAKTPFSKAEARTLMPKAEPFVDRAFEVAQKYPKHPVACEAYIWGISLLKSGPKVDAALDFVAEEMADSDKIERLCQTLPFVHSGRAEPLLRKIIEKNQHPNVLAKALFGLAKRLDWLASTAEYIHLNPEMSDQVTRNLTEHTANRIRNLDIKATIAEQEQLYERILREFPDERVRDQPLSQLVERELFEIRSLAIGCTAPEIDGEDVDGVRYRLSDYRGKVVVLSFWGSEWGPYKAMISHHRVLVERTAGKPFVLLGINCDRSKTELKNFMKKEHITWRSWWDGGSTPGPISRQWNISGWPTIYVLDGKGVIRFKSLRGEKLDSAVDILLEELAVEALKP